MTEEVKQDLIRCSRCKCRMLPEFFEVKPRTGNRLKTCKRCRGMYQCSFSGCNYKCSLPDILKSHIKQVHDKIKDKVCSFDGCGYKCSMPETLKRHIEMVHDKIKDKVCPECDYICCKATTMKRHQETCNGIGSGSAGERKIKNTLNEMGFSYVFGCSYKLKNEKENYLKWDFVVQTEDDPIFIEYDGSQHTISAWGGIEGLKTRQHHDTLKNQFCEENNLLLLRISYRDYGNILQIITEFMTTHTTWRD